MKTKQLISAALVVAVAALATASVAMAKTKTYNVSATTDGTTDANNVSTGTAKSKALGKCKLRGVLALPKYTAVWKCKGGNVKISAITVSGTANTVKSTMTVTGGTGKYKGAKGKGIATGVISTGIFKYKFKMKVK